MTLLEVVNVIALAIKQTGVHVYTGPPSGPAAAAATKKAMDKRAGIVFITEEDTKVEGHAARVTTLSAKLYSPEDEQGYRKMLKLKDPVDPDSLQRNLVALGGADAKVVAVVPHEGSDGAPDYVDFLIDVRYT